MSRPIFAIAREIERDWPEPHYSAVPYLRAMRELVGPDDFIGEDRADMVIRYFLSNARTWRGPVARRIKAELKRLIS